MDNAFVVRIDELRDAYIQLTPELADEINHAVAKAAKELGVNVVISALCDRNEELQVLAA